MWNDFNSRSKPSKLQRGGRLGMSIVVALVLWVLVNGLSNILCACHDFPLKYLTLSMVALHLITLLRA